MATIRSEVATLKKRQKVGVRALKNQASRIVNEVRERRKEYVVTQRGKPVAVLRPWSDEDALDTARARAVKAVSRLRRTARKVACAAGRKSARAAVSRQRR